MTHDDPQIENELHRQMERDELILQRPTMTQKNVV